jgi:hypothetical protein
MLFITKLLAYTLISEKKKTYKYFDDYDLKMMDGGDHLSEHEQETHVPHAACSGHFLIF